MKIFNFMCAALVMSVSSLSAIGSSQNSSGGTGVQNQYQNPNRSLTMNDQQDQTDMKGAANQNQSMQSKGNQDQPDTKAKAKTAADDALIVSVRNALQAETSFSPLVRNIQVSADNGTVTVIGVVMSDAEKTNVERVVKGVSGVTNVSNNLVVKSQ